MTIRRPLPSSSPSGQLDPSLRKELEARGIDSLEALSDPGLGLEVVTHRSSWVRRIDLGTAGEIYIKTYSYATWNDKLRGIGRTTWLAPSRAARESAALSRLREGGFETPAHWASWEIRRLGILERAILLSAALPGAALDRLLPTLEAEDQARLLRRLRDWVTELHRNGFRDRNLDARNLIAWRDDSAAWRLAKIDSPRWRLSRGRAGDDPLADADWQRLDTSLLQLGQALPPTGLRGL